MENFVFFETISQPKGILFIVPFVILMLALAGLMIGIVFSVKSSSIALKDGEIIIKALFYGRKIPVENVLIDESRTINLREEEQYDVSIRMNGISMPGIHSGWMRLKNGQKALVFLTDKEKVLLMQTKDYPVLFSMENTEIFIDKLRQLKK